MILNIFRQSNSKKMIQEKVQLLVQQAKTENGLNLEKKLKEIWNLAELEDYKLPFTQPSLGFVQFLVSLLKNETGLILRNALGCLWYLSRAIPNREYFGRKEVEIVSILMAMNYSNHIYKNFSFLILVNVCLHPATHDYLLSDEVGLIEYYRTQALANPSDIAAFRFFGNLTNVLQDTHVEQLLKHRVHGILMDSLRSAGANAIAWEGRFGGVEYWTLNALFGLSATTKGAQAIRELNNREFFYCLAQQTDVDGLKAGCILANVYGAEENLLLFQRYPEFCPLLLDILIATLDSNQGEIAEKLRHRGFTFGILKLDILTSVLNVLAGNETNKEILLQQTRLIPSLCRILKLFIDDAPELSAVYDYKVYAGGGGEDYETIINCAELLLQLSFSENYLVLPVAQKQKLFHHLQQIVTLPPTRTVPLAARICARELLSK